MNTAQAIELKNVSKRYDAAMVIENIDLQVGQGESLVLVGHNGAGKTTLMKLMLGLTLPSTGQVIVMGQNPANKSLGRQYPLLGYLPESVSFYQHMTGRELLGYYARLKGVPITQVDQRLEQVGLLTAAKKRLRTYSKGMRQRLGLAQAILGNPKLLFLDEPTTGLDPSLRHDFYRIIAELRSDGATVVFSSHSLNEIETQADRIALIRNGKLVAHGSLEDLGNLACLPVRTRLRISSAGSASVVRRLEPHFQLRQLNKNEIDLFCPASEKITLLRHISELGDTVLDISMNAPRLDEIYLHFMREEKS